MSEQEFNDLVADINKHGLRDEIDVWDQRGYPEIIEGAHRARACQELGIEPRYRQRRFETEADALAFVISKNIHRRHLNAEQKRALIGTLLEADPTRSDTAIGKQAKASKNTVAKVRKEKEGRGQLDHVEKRTDTKGRKQPAQKQKAAKVSPAATTPSPAQDTAPPALETRATDDDDIQQAAAPSAVRKPRQKPTFAEKIRDLLEGIQAEDPDFSVTKAALLDLQGEQLADFDLPGLAAWLAERLTIPQVHKLSGLTVDLIKAKQAQQAA
jgi:hypothetical protein